MQNLLDTEPRQPWQFITIRDHINKNKKQQQKKPKNTKIKTNNVMMSLKDLKYLFNTSD